MPAPGCRTADPSPSPTAGLTSWNSPPWMSPAIRIRSIASHSRSTRRDRPSSPSRPRATRPARRSSFRGRRPTTIRASPATKSAWTTDPSPPSEASPRCCSTSPRDPTSSRSGPRIGRASRRPVPSRFTCRPILALAGSLSVRCRGPLFRLPRHHPLGEPRHLRDPHELRRLRQLPHEPSERVRLREPVPLLRRESEPAELPLPHGRLGLRLPRIRWGSAVERLHERRMERDEHRRPPRGGEPDVEGVHGGHAEQLLRLELRPLRGPSRSVRVLQGHRDEPDALRPRRPVRIRGRRPPERPRIAIARIVLHVVHAAPLQRHARLTVWDPGLATLRI